jgi:hypothetical protein
LRKMAVNGLCLNTLTGTTKNGLTVETTLLREATTAKGSTEYLE